MHEIGYRTGNLKIVLKVFARDFPRGQNGLALKRTDLERLKANIHGAAGGRPPRMPLADVMDRGKAERRYAGVEYAVVRCLPEGARIVDKRLAIQKHVENDIGVEKNAHYPCFC